VRAIPGQFDSPLSKVWVFPRSRQKAEVSGPSTARAATGGVLLIHAEHRTQLIKAQRVPNRLATLPG